jgi:hypothetical protein
VRIRLALLGGVFAFAWTVAHAGDVEVVAVTFDKQGKTWTVDTTLRHADSGWDHYANAWRVVTVDGSVVGTRTLYHPHVDEQPFTRSLSGVAIPDGTTVVFVEAHDKVHGWSKQRVRVDLTQSAGERYRVNSPSP